MASAYDNLAGELSGIGLWGGYYAAGQVHMRDVAGAAKMGFASMNDAKKFSDIRNSHPALQSLFTKIGDKAVPIRDNDANKLVAQNGQPVATKYDPVMASFGAKFRSDPKFLNNLEKDLKQNPQLEGRLIQAIEKNPRAVAAGMRSYTGADGVGPNGARTGQIEQMVDRVLAPAAPVAAPAKAAAAPVQAKVEPRTDHKPEVRTPKVEPMAVVAGAAGVGAASSATAGTPAAADTGETLQAPAANPNAKLILAAKDIGGANHLADQVADRVETLFPDMKNDAETFRAKIKGDPQLQAQIADNLNKHPEFMQKFSALTQPGKGNENGENLLKQYGRPDIMGLMQNPSKLADSSYIDSLSNKMSMASNPLSGIGNFFKGMGLDLSGMGAFFSKIFESIGNLFKGMGSGGSFLSMSNFTSGGGDFFSHLSNGFSGMTHGIGEAKDFGDWAKNHERFALSDAQGRVIDRNHDGKITDADQTVVRDAEGKEHKVFETSNSGTAQYDGREVKSYVTTVDPQTGRPTAAITIFSKDGQTASRDDATGRPVAGYANTAPANDAPAAPFAPPPPAPKVAGLEANRMGVGPVAPTS